MKKLISLLTALVMAVSVFAFTAGTPAYAAEYRTAANAASASYKSGKYYANYQKVPLTGDNRTDVIALALSQAGYLESNSDGSFAGTTAGSGNYTEYNYNMGNWGSGYAYEWCATFVSWALYQSHSTDQGRIADWCRSHTNDKNYVWREVGCSRWADQLRKYGYFQYSAHNGGSYKPQSGDLIFYDWAGGKSGEDHIGLVVFSDNSYVYTIEGNTSDAQGLVSAGGGVFFKKYALTYDKITGYGVLPYTGVNLQRRIDFSGATRTTGLYINPQNAKTLYKAETGTDSDREMPRFTLFEVTEIASNGRLKVKYTQGSTEYTGYVVENSSNMILQVTSNEITECKEHKFVWENGTNGHHQHCTVCGFNTEDVAHVYDNAFDASCNLCGATREAALLGDVDGDGTVDNLDAIKILIHDAGKTALEGTALAAADVNGDGEADSMDASQILMLDAGIINGFAAGTGNYALSATYKAARDDVYDDTEDGRAQMYLGYENGSIAYADASHTRLNDGVVTPGEELDAQGNGTANVSVCYTGTDRIFNVDFAFPETYDDINTVVFRNARDGVANGNNRGFILRGIQVSDDGEAWNTVKLTETARKAVEGAPEMRSQDGSSYNVEHFDITYTLEAPSYGKYMKIYFSNNGAYIAQLDEIEIYGK